MEVVDAAGVHDFQQVLQLWLNDVVANNAEAAGQRADEHGRGSAGLVAGCADGHAAGERGICHVGDVKLAFAQRDAGGIGDERGAAQGEQGSRVRFIAPQGRSRGIENGAINRTLPLYFPGANVNEGGFEGMALGFFGGYFVELGAGGRFEDSVEDESCFDQRVD